LLHGFELAGGEADNRDASYHLTLTATEVFPTGVIRVIYSPTAAPRKPPASPTAVHLENWIVSRGRCQVAQRRTPRDGHVRSRTPGDEQVPAHDRGSLSHRDLEQVHGSPPTVEENRVPAGRPNSLGADRRCPARIRQRAG
jgi:hypothetical protein